MKPIQQVSLRQLRDEKYARVLCYPEYSTEEAVKRIRQLKQLGVKAIEFTGEKRAFNLSVLGKGQVGIVVVVYTKTGRAALKIRRVDADRKEMEHEAEMLATANRLGIGPHLLDKKEDFLLMELVSGLLLPDWVKQVRGKGARNRIRSVLRDILEQCYVLDHAGLDHGELSHAPKHIIIDARHNSHIVDFETASIARRTTNVTSICQYLFISSQLARTLEYRLGEIDDLRLVTVLRQYKHEPTRQNFDKIIRTCNLASSAQ